MILSQAVEINVPRIVHDEIDREVLAIDLATGTYFSMRGPARALWHLLTAGPAGIDDAVSAVLAGYPDAPPDAAGEIRSFIELLVGHDLLRGSEGTTGAPSLPGEDLGPYAPPVVEAFTDMQELVLLDPVHDVGAAGWPNRPGGE